MKKSTKLLVGGHLAAVVIFVSCGLWVVNRGLIDAAETGNILMVKWLLVIGTDVNAKDNGGYTPLHEAVMWGYKEIAELLIANGADVNAKDDRGVTPLIYAADRGHKEIAELLIANGADVNAKDKRGKTPLDWAKNELADLLRKHGGKMGEELKAEGK